MLGKNIKAMRREASRAHESFDCALARLALRLIGAAFILAQRMIPQASIIKAGGIIL
jgi:membrane-bound ClpP family serine protease